jgi:hypothetical protein
MNNLHLRRSPRASGEKQNRQNRPDNANFVAPRLCVDVFRHDDLLREAVEQAGAACAYKVGLAAAIAGMSGIPGVRILPATLFVMMTDLSITGGRTRPVVTRHVAGKRSSIGGGPSQNVVRVGSVPAAVDHGSFLGQGTLFAQSVFVAVEVIHILSHDHTFRVLPWSLPDAISSVHGGLSTSSTRTQVGAPRLGSGTNG